MTLSIVILAAGQGKRMYSQTPKVLHPLAGKPLLKHVVHTAEQLKPSQPPIVVYGHKGDIIRATLSDLNVTWVEQAEQLGTGHALQQALHKIPEQHRVLVLYGDVPLISANTLEQFIKSIPNEDVGVITAHFANPNAFGRVIRNEKNEIINIIEDKDLAEAQRSIHEINTGIYLFPPGYLTRALPQLKNNNAQNEYYLTDLIQFAVNDKLIVNGLKALTSEEVSGVNDRLQLIQLERFYQKNYAEKLLKQGVTIRDPERFDVRGELIIGHDVVIDINVVFEGKVVIGDNCTIGPNTVLRNVTLGNGVEIKSHSVLDGAEVGDQCVIGPFARLRPGTVLSGHAHVGNFVEIKNSYIKENSKVNHLSYIGDAEVGARVNIGAGTITCNYDGASKHKTTIGDGSFIGSHTSLVAPLTIGEGAYIGTSSVITRDAPPHQLTVCRAREQRSIKHWKKPIKKES